MSQSTPPNPMSQETFDFLWQTLGDVSHNGAFTQITNRDLDIGVGLADDTATLQVESFHARAVDKFRSVLAHAKQGTVQTASDCLELKDLSH